MGTDIHGCFEAKEANTGKWLAFENISYSRSYLWFGILAGIRQVEEYAFKFDPRGIPDDPSPAWKAECSIDWMHGYSWLKPSEVKEANARLRQRGMEMWGVDFAHTPVLVPSPDTKMTKLILELEYPNNRTIPWAGTLRQFIGEDADFEESVRMVFAFDS